MAVNLEDIKFGIARTIYISMSDGNAVENSFSGSSNPNFESWNSHAVRVHNETAINLEKCLEGADQETIYEALEYFGPDSTVNLLDYIAGAETFYKVEPLLLATFQLLHPESGISSSRELVEKYSPLQLRNPVATVAQERGPTISEKVKSPKFQISDLKSSFDLKIALGNTAYNPEVFPQALSGFFPALFEQALNRLESEDILSSSEQAHVAMIIAIATAALFGYEDNTFDGAQNDDPIALKWSNRLKDLQGDEKVVERLSRIESRAAKLEGRYKDMFLTPITFARDIYMWDSMKKLKAVLLQNDDFTAVHGDRIECVLSL